MTNIIETPQWESQIHLLSRTEKVEGGADGAANKQASQLANRTSFLKESVEAFSSLIKSGELPYTSFAVAQTALSAGKIPANSRISVRSAKPGVWVEEYVNTAGTLVATGKTILSNLAIAPVFAPAAGDPTGTLTGLAGTTEGQFFWAATLDESSVSRLTLYINESGSAVKITSVLQDDFLLSSDIAVSRLPVFRRGKNLYNHRTSVNGKFLNESGVVSDRPDYMLSDYIPVGANLPLICNYDQRFIHFFDADRKLIGYQTYQSQFTTPAGTAWLRVTMSVLSRETLQIEAGTVRTAFESYREHLAPLLPDGTPVSIRETMGVAPGKNLFDRAKATVGYVINETGALAVASTYCVSDYIRVAAGGMFRGSQLLRYIAFFDKDKKWLSTLQNQTAAFTVPATAAYMRVSVLAARMDYAQVEAGSKMTELAPYSLTAASTLDGEAVSYPVKTQSLYSLGLFQRGKNIFNPHTLTAGFIDENGFISPGGTAFKFSEYLAVLPSTGYVAPKSMRFVSFFDADKAFLSTVASTSSPGGVLTAITTPATAAYVRVTLAVANIAGFQLEKGSVVTAYEDFYLELRSNLPNGEPLKASATEQEEPTPDFYAPERLRETRQRITKLSFGATGTDARVTIASGCDSYSRDTSIYLLRTARRLWALYQAGVQPNNAGPIGWGYLSFGGADTSLKNGSIINPNAITSSGFVGTYYGGDSPDISVMTSSTAGATLAWAEDFRLARSHTLFAEGGSGVISYFATGMTEPKQLDLSMLAAGIQFIPLNDIPTTANGTFTITVVSGTVKLYGMNIVDPTASGVVWHKLGASGSSTADWVARDATRWKKSFAALGADLFTIMTGTNDQGAGMTAATFRANLLELIDRARDARPNIDILLICPAENQRTTNVLPMTTYARVMYEIARDDRDVAFLNLQSSFGVKPADYAAGSTRPWMNVDGIHPAPDTGGYAIVAALLRMMGLPAV